MCINNGIDLRSASNSLSVNGVSGTNFLAPSEEIYCVLGDGDVSLLGMILLLLDVTPDSSVCNISAIFNKAVLAMVDFAPGIFDCRLANKSPGYWEVAGEASVMVVGWSYVPALGAMKLLTVALT